MAYEREHIATLASRLDEAQERLIVVTGPRRTGKTTLVLQALERIGRRGRRKHYLPIDNPNSETLPSFLGGENSFDVPYDALSLTGKRDTRWRARQWERARLEADRSGRGLVLAIDEVQKVPDWSEAVKGLWDADRSRGRRFHVILLGSAPLRAVRGMAADRRVADSGPEAFSGLARDAVPGEGLAAARLPTPRARSPDAGPR